MASDPSHAAVTSPLARLVATLHGQLWWGRAMTLGVRVIAVRDEAVLLVRHTYVAGWYLPGGGVERGESCETAAVRELREEAGLRCGGRPELHGLFRNGERDHVACYVARTIEGEAIPRARFREIEQATFFPVDHLPDGTTPATRARLREWRDRLPPSVDW